MTILQFIRNLFYGKANVAHSTQPINLFTMKELVDQITSKVIAIQTDLNKFEVGNKTAGKRVRKASLELEKLFKEFRKRSVHENV